MATNNYFKTTGISQRERSSLVVSSFGGVDYMSTPLTCSDSRATEIKNFIKRDNINQKRYGWADLAFISSGYAIRGIYEFKLPVYGTKILVLCGKILYELKNIDTVKEFELAEIEEIGLLTNDESNKVNAFVTEKAIYFLTGDKYKIVYWNETSESFEIENVDEYENTYIPRVLLNVRYDRNDTIRSAYDDFNMMTQYVTISGLTHSFSTADYDDIASGTLTPTYRMLLGVDFNLSLNGNTYSLSDLVTNSVTLTNTKIKLTLNGTEYTPSYITIEGSYYLGFTIGDSAHAYFKEDNNNLYLYFDSDIESTLVSGENNMFITYPHYVAGYADKINKCTFGILYGNEGSQRLFASGNPTYQNMDFHSTGNVGDYTYFSDLDYCKYGSNLTAVKGYNIMNDGTLCVLKESSALEPTIYFRTASYTTATDYSGATVYASDETTALQEEVFPMSTGNIGEGCVNTESFKTFGQDTVFLSKNGLYGITIGSSINSNVKYARERSRLVNPRLCKHDLSQASVIVYDGKYYIAIDGICYIADARYATQLEDDLNSYQYEFWVWDNIPAVCWFIHNNELYFGTKDGHIAKFITNNFQDRSYITNSSTLTFESSSNRLYCSALNGREIKEGNLKLTLEDCFTTSLYGELGLVGSDKQIKLKNGKLTFDFGNDEINQTMELLLFDGREIKVDLIEGDTNNVLSEDTKYIISRYDDDNNSLPYHTFRLFDESMTNEITITSSMSFRICYKLNETLDIEAETSDNVYNGYFKIKGNFSSYVTMAYTDTLSQIKVFVIYVQNVSSYYLTKSYSFGTTIRSKNIFSFGITNSVNTNTDIDIGIRYKSNDINDIYNNQRETIGVDFTSFTFSPLSFSNEMYDKSVTIPYKIRKVNFVQFMFKNDKSTNSSVNNLTVLYSFGFMNRGVN